MIAPNEPGHLPPPRRLVFAGQAIVDVIMSVPALPERGGDMLASFSAVTAGGGFNTMAAAARHGLPVLYAGGHGTGPWGDLVRAALAAEGIGVLRPVDHDRDTGFDVALVEPDAERTFVTHMGAEAISGPQSWDAVPAGPGDAVYVSGYGLVAPESGPVLGGWAASLPTGVLLFLDPGPLVMQIPAAVLDPVLARCDWLSCNQREAALLANSSPAAEPVGPAGADGPSGTAGPADRDDRDDRTDPVDPAAAARRLLDCTARAEILVRAGAAGCYVAQRVPGRAAGAPVRVPAPRVTAVDTTGAGDAHSGVFLAALADGLVPLDAAARANAAAAFAVTRLGPATSPTRSQLDAWLDSASSHGRGPAV
jgi:sugar/nucleoside kinase (ribokinase family)